MAQHLKPRQATIVLYQGDDMARLAELARAKDHATGGSRMDDGADEQAAYDAFLDEAAERAVEFVVQTIGSRRWRDLVMAHPPRMVPEEVEANRALSETEPQTVPTGKMVEHEADVQWGVNTETFPRALLMYVDPGKPEAQTIAAPEFADESERAEFVDDDLAEGDFEKAWITAFQLNASPSRDPKAFTSAQRSDESTT